MVNPHVPQYLPHQQELRHLPDFLIGPSGIFGLERLHDLLQTGLGIHDCRVPKKYYAVCQKMAGK